MMMQGQSRRDYRQDSWRPAPKTAQDPQPVYRHREPTPIQRARPKRAYSPSRPTDEDGAEDVYDPPSLTGDGESYQGTGSGDQQHPHPDRHEGGSNGRTNGFGLAPAPDSKALSPGFISTRDQHTASDQVGRPYAYSGSPGASPRHADSSHIIRPLFPQRRMEPEEMEGYDQNRTQSRRKGSIDSRNGHADIHRAGPVHDSTPRQERRYNTRSTNHLPPSPPPSKSRPKKKGREAVQAQGISRMESPRYESPFRQLGGEGIAGPSIHSAPRSSGLAASRKKAKPAPNYFLPSREYIALSHPTNAHATLPQHAPHQTKLLVLDLNGALVYRSGTKVSYPRPYLANLLAYVFTPEPANDSRPVEPTGAAHRPLEAFVWSSAQPQNVRLMVEKAFGTWGQDVWSEDNGDDAHMNGREERRAERRRRGEGRLMGVWARDKMRLPADQYHLHVATVKDLRDLHAGIAGSLDVPSQSDIYYRRYSFDERTTILLDDSTAKAMHQPWNHICLPEYDTDEHRSSQIWSSSNGSKGELDEYLLCVIGILEELRNWDNVPGWIRGGGLKSIYPENAQEGYDEPTLQSLPSHKSYTQWYDIPDMVRYWRERGVRALERKGIEVAPAVDMTTYRANGNGNGNGKGAANGTPRGGTPARDVGEMMGDMGMGNGAYGGYGGYGDYDERYTSSGANTADHWRQRDGVSPCGGANGNGDANGYGSPRYTETHRRHGPGPDVWIDTVGHQSFSPSYHGYTDNGAYSRSGSSTPHYHYHRQMRSPEYENAWIDTAGDQPPSHFGQNGSSSRPYDQGPYRPPQNLPPFPPVLDGQYYSQDPSSNSAPYAMNAQPPAYQPYIPPGARRRMEQQSGAIDKHPGLLHQANGFGQHSTQLQPLRMGFDQPQPRDTFPHAVMHGEQDQRPFLSGDAGNTGGPGSGSAQAGQGNGPGGTSQQATKSRRRKAKKERKREKKAMEAGAGQQ